MGEPTVQIFQAMEREATLTVTPAGFELVKLEDCTGATFELYPWEVEILWQFVEKHSEELRVRNRGG
jgi:hypothetical protein